MKEELKGKLGWRGRVLTMPKKKRIVKPATTVEIQEMNDCFDIIVDDERFHFDQENNKKGLAKVFAKLGIKATYTEVY